MKIFKKVAIFTSALMILTSITAFAFTAGQTLMTYNGSQIRGLNSINAWTFMYAGNSVKNIHNTTEWWDSAPNQEVMRVSIQRKNALGIYGSYSSAGSVDYSGTGQFSHSFWINDSGTYKLNFSSIYSPSSADINGSVNFNSGADQN